MKLLRILTLAAPLALALPLAAHAAMTAQTRADFINDCVSQAGKSLNESTAKAHCACGADQVNQNFSDAEILQLSETAAAPNQKLMARLQKAVAEQCVQAKK